MSYRVNRKIRDTRVYQAIDQLIWESPELKDNKWLKHRQEVVEMIEDEGVRSPPLSAIFEEEGVITVDEQQESLITLMLNKRKEETQ